jgi:tripartite-type tricarboxylate transporter receptor subunit TctC
VFLITYMNMRIAFLFVSLVFVILRCQGADVYPNRPVRVVAPSAPGSTTDFTARMIAQQLSERLGKPFIVDNRGGAGGIIGNDIVAKAAPDGYTLLIATPSFTVLSAMTKSLPYDASKDFTAIAHMVRFTNALVVIPALNVTTLKEFIALAQAYPRKFNYGSSGYGGATHIWPELFKKAAKVDLEHVSFKGGGATVAAMLAGEVQMMLTTIPTFIAHVKSGKLRALAVTTDGERSPALPDVLSMREAGLNGMSVYGWQGIVGPVGMSRAVINKLHGEVAKVLDMPAVIKPFVAEAGAVVKSSPEEFSAYIRDELRRWVDVVKSAGITPQ